MSKTIYSEFQKMIRDPFIIFALFLLPIGVNVLLGFQFQNDVIQRIPMAVVDQDNSVLSRTIVQQFQENETFDVKYHPENPDEIQSLMDSGRIGAGMVIPKDFYSDVLKLNSPTLLMVYDGSHISVASTAKTKATEILLTLRTGTLMKLIKGKLNAPEDVAEKIALAVQINNRTLYNPAKSFKNFINPGFGAAAVQSAIALLAAAAILPEEMPSRRRKRIMYVAGKSLFYTLGGTMSLLICIAIQAGMFHIPFRGSLLAAILLSFVFSASICCFAIMTSAWLKNKSMSVLLNALIFVPSTIMAGYTWPTLAMTPSYKAMSSFQPFSHYVDNLRDLYLKGVQMKILLSDTQWLLNFTLISFFLACVGVCSINLSQSNRGTLLKEGAEIEFS